MAKMAMTCFMNDPLPDVTNLDGTVAESEHC